MKELVNTLKKQHQMILGMLDHPELARDLIHFVENEHHPLEELELFPFLQKQSCLSQGGPRCGLYMGLRLELNPLTTMQEHLKKLYAKTSFRPKDYPVPDWLTAQSPLSIPFEEHVIGADLAQSLLFLLEPENTSLHKEFFAQLYGDYCHLLRLHIDKEDNCLFILCERVLT